jgi:hypothetical protein
MLRIRDVFNLVGQTEH